LLSIVIPARDAASTIATQLAAIAAQPVPPGVEVIVADNGSTDRTVAIAEAWTESLPVRIVDASARPGAAAARNIGAAAAAGSLIVFVDSDDVVMPGWLDAWTAHEPGPAIAGGPVIFFSGEPPTEVGPVPRWLTVHMGFLPYALGANLGVWRTAFERVGGFDESWAVGEDVELSWRLLLAGERIGYVPGAVVAKRDASTVGAVLRQHYRYGAADPLLYRAFRDQGLPRPSARATLRSYAGVVARLPLLGGAEQRRRWSHQAGRRAGRIAGSIRARVTYL
jgi:GT2 family glycosyltransferase